MARRKALAATLLVAIFLAIVWIVYHSFLRDDSRVTLPGHFGRLQCVAFSRDGKTIAAGNTKTEKQADDTVWNVGYVKLWDVETQEERGFFPLGRGSGADGIIFSPVGGFLAVLHSGVTLWDGQTGNYLAYYPGSGAVAFAPNGALLASSSEKTIQVFECPVRKDGPSLIGHFDEVWALAFAPDGQTLASGSKDGTVRIWDHRQVRELNVLLAHGGGVTAVAFAADGTTLGSSSRDGTVRLWDWKNGRERKVIPFSAPSPLGSRPQPVAFSPDLKVIAVIDWSVVRLISTDTGQEFMVLRGHRDRIYDAEFSPDGRTLATCSGDGAVKLWDVPHPE
jgi:WD40 repeat protein